MKRRLFFWQLGGFLFTSISGTLLHFLYEWTNNSVLVAPFSGVNESTWEHMKLLYFPLLIFAFFQSKHFLQYKSFWCIKLIGILFGLTLIPVLFYTYNGVFGKSPDWVNISIFFVSAAALFSLEYKLFKEHKLRCKYLLLAFCFICFIGILFFIFTFVPPNIPLFKDPLITA